MYDLYSAVNMSTSQGALIIIIILCPINDEDIKHDMYTYSITDQMEDTNLSKIQSNPLLRTHNSTTVTSSTISTLAEHSLSRNQFLSCLKTHLFTLSYPP